MHYATTPKLNCALKKWKVKRFPEKRPENEDKLRILETPNWEDFANICGTSPNIRKLPKLHRYT